MLSPAELVRSASDTIRILPLGGLGEVGMNMMVYICRGEAIIVDCGVLFPDEKTPGVDYLYADFSALVESGIPIKGLLITHGHEDHIGAIPFLLKTLPELPIFGTSLSIRMLEEKLKEYHLDESTDLNVVERREIATISEIWQTEFIAVTHSIPEASSLAIITPVGTILHSGDFKFDQQPSDGNTTDYARLTHYGEQGVLCLLSDSTNAERKGYSQSEASIVPQLDDAIRTSEQKVIVACFSSNLLRIQKILDIAHSYGRRVLLNGRSLEKNTRIARELGIIKVPEECLVTVNQFLNLPAEQQLIISTGSQGEPRSSLTRMALDEHRKLKINPGDKVILSSKFIPGNERVISHLINHLYNRGATVVHEKVSHIHVSGHASQEELKMMINMIQPESFIPLHGETRHLRAHQDLAIGMEVPTTAIVRNGEVWDLKAPIGKKGRKPLTITQAGSVTSGRNFMDGKSQAGVIGDVVLRDRRHLSEDGFIWVALGLDVQTGTSLFGPEIFTKGLLLESEVEQVTNQLVDLVSAELATISLEALQEVPAVEDLIRRRVRGYTRKNLNRFPMVQIQVIEL